MQKPIFLMLLVLAQPARGAVLAEDAYTCADQQIAQRIVADPELAALGANLLFERIAAAAAELERQIAKLDLDGAKIQERVDADREVVKAGKTLEFQAGIRQNWRPTEQALRQGEAKLASLQGERDRLLGEQKRWTEISGSCSAPTERSNVAVVQVLAKSKLTQIRAATGDPARRAWVPSRFVVKPAGKK